MPEIVYAVSELAIQKTVLFGLPQIRLESGRFY